MADVGTENIDLLVVIGAADAALKKLQIKVDCPQVLLESNEMPDSRRLIWKGDADSIVGEIAQYCEWDTELEARLTHKFVQPKEA